MGPDHRPYALLAILVVVGVLFPLVLLFLYPMQWFQKCLNRCGLNSPDLQMFMQCFQGYYRDRTDGGRECKYFVAVYPAAILLYDIWDYISIHLCFLFVSINFQYTSLANDCYINIRVVYAYLFNNIVSGINM